MTEDAETSPWRRRAGLDPAARRRVERVQRMAKVLDSRFTVPGTSRTFGIDAVVGLIPGVGGAAGLVMSVGVIVQAVYAGARIPTVVRMLGIAGADALIGSIPLLGTIADFVIKANERNARILTSQALQPDRTTAESRRVVTTTLLIAVLAVGLVLVAAVVALVLVIRAIF